MMFGKTLDASTVADVLPDWPTGPLESYRSKATFDWRTMKLLMEGEDVIRFKNRIWSEFEKDPIFQRTPWDEPSRDEERKSTFLRLRRLVEGKFVNEEEYLINPYLVPAFVQAIGQYDWSLCLKRELSTEYFILSAKTGGNQHDKFINDIKEFRALGAIVITELAHGSDTKMLRTKATFDPKTQEFVLSTPDLEATKVWCGVLGQTATHAIVFAQLETNGETHGIHQFLVPIRNPKTLIPYSGLKIGDLGAKIGLNGLDNGFMQFKDYRIPRSALLNKNADLTSSGVYKTSMKDETKRFGRTLGILSCGRVFIILKSVSNLQSAIAISTRYSAVRKQFGPPNGEEWPVIEYQTQQWRLFPYIAASFVLHNFFLSLYRDYVDFLIGSFVLDSPQESDMGSELHCVSSCGKAMCGWLARDAIQESRECCGGHGYLKASRLAELRNDHDANNTYEGDNNVLLQQTSNHLLKIYKEKVDEGKQIESPFGSVLFINDLDTIIGRKMRTNITDINSVIEAYQFLVCWLLKKSIDKLDDQMHLAKDDPFVAKSQTQVYYLRSLSITFFECDAIQRYVHFLTETTCPDNMKAVLGDLGLLYGLWSLEKHLAILYEAGFVPAEAQPGVPFNPALEIRETILTLCAKIKDNAVSLVDVFAPPDFVLNSSLGYSDGRIYENIFDALTNNKGAFERPQWYKEFTENKPIITTVDDVSSMMKAKL
ncbi:Peroxisomal acyl-coenzyme A oxidase 3 [Halotydeus destructor]|nr:Peroxisomal acyl-coenzyme A oxidase 3 [Halotydeus destructor]